MARIESGCGGDIEGEGDAGSEGDDGGEDSYGMCNGKVECDCMCESTGERLGLGERDDECCCGNSSGLDREVELKDERIVSSERSRS